MPTYWRATFGAFVYNGHNAGLTGGRRCLCLAPPSPAVTTAGRHNELVNIPNRYHSSRCLPPYAKPPAYRYHLHMLPFAYCRCSRGLGRNDMPASAFAVPAAPPGGGWRRLWVAPGMTCAAVAAMVFVRAVELARLYGSDQHCRDAAFAGRFAVAGFAVVYLPPFLFALFAICRGGFVAVAAACIPACGVLCATPFSVYYFSYLFVIPVVAEHPSLRWFCCGDSLACAGFFRCAAFRRL